MRQSPPITNCLQVIVLLLVPTLVSMQFRGVVDQNVLMTLPLHDEVQLFSYGDKIHRLACITIETAILHGWKFQMIGPTLKLNKTFGAGGSSNDKLVILSNLARQLPERTNVIFVDAFDVIAQRGPASLPNAATSFNTSLVTFGAESNCYPFKRVDHGYHCERFQGALYLDSHKHNPHNGGGGPFQPGEIIPLGCMLQDNLMPSSSADPFARYLNSGMSTGRVAGYRNLVKAISELMEDLPLICMEDQGIISWLYGNQVTPLALDYNSTLFGNVRNVNTVFNESTCLWDLHSPFSPHAYTPTFLHHNGPKTDLSAFRNRLVECMFRRDHDGYLAFIAKATFYLDGIETKFNSVCSGHLDPDPYRIHPEGTLLVCSKEIFLFTNSTIRAFPNIGIFASWGHELSQVVRIDCDALGRWPLGKPMEERVAPSVHTALL